MKKFNLIMKKAIFPSTVILLLLAACSHAQQKTIPGKSVLFLILAYRYTPTYNINPAKIKGSPAALCYKHASLPNIC